MSGNRPSNEVALRIGLATRAIPGATPATMLGVLQSIVGSPLTARKLTRVRVNRFVRAAGPLWQGLNDSNARTAVALLRGKGVELRGEPPPDLSPDADRPLPHAVRLACASNNGDLIDGAFATCTRYLIYLVTASESRLVAIRPQPESAVEGRLRRAELIADCDLLCTTDIGNRAASSVVGAGIHPVRLASSTRASEFIAELQQVLRKDMPPPWLARLVGRDDAAAMAGGPQRQVNDNHRKEVRYGSATTD